jgi:hypothetical protein
MQSLLPCSSGDHAYGADASEAPVGGEPGVARACVQATARAATAHMRRHRDGRRMRRPTCSAEA